MDDMAEQQLLDQSVIERLAQDVLAERRRSRRWSIFFRSVAAVLAALFLVAVLALGGFGQKVCLDRCTATVRIEGEIEERGRASASNVIGALRQAFEYPQVKGVIVAINSPGGSPVQAGQIYDELRRLRAKHPDKPAVAVVGDMAASGGYYIAAGADQIVVDRASLVGSIGVIMQGFGFTEAIDKLGIERRVIASGERKGFLDPFRPLAPADETHIRGILDEVHGQFVKAVRDGRGAKLKESPELFTGLVWTGARAIELGLADALGSIDSVAREVIKAEEVVDFTLEESLPDRVARRLGTTIARHISLELRTPALR
jgi:protease-4